MLQFLTPAIVDTLDDIFAALTIADLDKKSTEYAEKIKVFRTCLPKFIAKFNDNIFFDEHAFLYQLITELKVRMYSIDQIRHLLAYNSELILNSPYIDLSKWGTQIGNRIVTDEEKLAAFEEELIAKINQLKDRYVTEEQFVSACNFYIAEYKDFLMTDTVQTMSLIMGDGAEVKKKGNRKEILKGSLKAQKYYEEKMAIIRALEEASRVQGTVINSRWYAKEAEADKEDTDSNSIFTFGIKEIDQTMGSLRRGNMIGILGPPKGGKTKLSNFIAGRALKLGLNVAVWALEGTKEEWISMQTALYIKLEKNQAYSSKDILQRKYANTAMRQEVASAKYMIANDPNRGQLSFIEGSAYVENFIDVLQNHYDTENPFDVIIIDSLVNMLSSSGRGKVERISESYMLLKDLVANKLPIKALAVLPAQLKQDVVDFIRRNPNETLDVTAGSESAETIRSPDEVIGLFSSKEERLNNQTKIYSVASRHSENFSDFTAGTELKCCYFYSLPTD